jgi:hypothetical protein
MQKVESLVLDVYHRTIIRGVIALEYGVLETMGFHSLGCASGSEEGFEEIDDHDSCQWWTGRDEGEPYTVPYTSAV